MSKKKQHTTDDAAPTLEGRIAQYFAVLPYGQPAGLSDLMLDLRDDELKSLVGKDEVESILKRLENDKFAVPPKKSDAEAMARGRAVESALEKLVKAGTLTRIKMDEPGKVGMGYYMEKRPDADPAPAAVKIEYIPRDQIKIRDSIQCRARGSDPKKVDEYAANADKLPAGRVYRLADGTLLLSRGFTRMKAWEKAGVEKVPMEVVDGTELDAKLDAIGDNATHGLPRSADDIREAIGKFLSLPGRKNSSIAAVAAAARCSWGYADKVVRALRRAAGQPEKPAEVVNKQGETQPATNRKPATTDAAPETDAPPAVAPAPPKTTGVKDKVGQDVPEGLVGAFTDTRFADAIRNINANLEFILNLRSDGYALSSIPVKEREGILNELSFPMSTLQMSMPFAVTPADANVFSANLKAASRRGWMNKAEWTEYTEAKDKAAKSGNPPAPAEPVSTEPTVPAPTEGAADGQPATAA